MKILLCGSRDMQDTYENRDLIHDAVRKEIGTDFWNDITIITGGAKGADTIAHSVAESNDAKTVVIMADWKRHGNGAGPIRNGKMLDLEPDLVIGFTLGKSVGTRNCLKQAKLRGIDTIQIPVPV